MKTPESGYHSAAISYSNCRQLALWLTWPAPSGLPKSNDGQEMLQLVPAPSNDLAQRLGVQHYPLLITATTIQQ